MLFKRTHMCGDLRSTEIGKDVVLNGWIQKRRNLGGLIFCDVRDKTGITQVVFNDETSDEHIQRRPCNHTHGQPQAVLRQITNQNRKETDAGL